MESYEEEDGHETVSFVDLGGYVTEHMKRGMEPVWFDLEQTMYWMIDGATGAKFINYKLGIDKAFKWLK